VHRAALAVEGPPGLRLPRGLEVLARVRVRVWVRVRVRVRVRVGVRVRVRARVRVRVRDSSSKRVVRLVTYSRTRGLMSSATGSATWLGRG